MSDLQQLTYFSLLVRNLNRVMSRENNLLRDPAAVGGLRDPISLQLLHHDPFLFTPPLSPPPAPPSPRLTGYSVEAAGRRRGASLASASENANCRASRRDATAPLYQRRQRDICVCFHLTLAARRRSL